MLWDEIFIQVIDLIRKFNYRDHLSTIVFLSSLIHSYRWFEQICRNFDLEPENGNIHHEHGFKRRAQLKSIRQLGINNDLTPYEASRSMKNYLNRWIRKRFPSVFTRPFGKGSIQTLSLLDMWTWITLTMFDFLLILEEFHFTIYCLHN